MTPALANQSSVIALPVPFPGDPSPHSHGCEHHTQAREQGRACTVSPSTPTVMGKKGLTPQDSVSAALLQIIKSLKSKI